MQNQKILPSIMGHTSEGCFEEIDFFGNPIYPESYTFINEEEKQKYGDPTHFDYSYDEEGNCTITKKLNKSIYNRKIQ